MSENKLDLHLLFNVEGSWSLDQTGGWHKQNFVIAGLPKSGKTSLVRDIARRVAANVKACDTIAVQSLANLSAIVERAIPTDSRDLFVVLDMDFADLRAVMPSIEPHLHVYYIVTVLLPSEAAKSSKRAAFLASWAEESAPFFNRVLFTHPLPAWFVPHAVLEWVHNDRPLCEQVLSQRKTILAHLKSAPREHFKALLCCRDEKAASAVLIVQYPPFAKKAVSDKQKPANRKQAQPVANVCEKLRAIVQNTHQAVGAAPHPMVNTTDSGGDTTLHVALEQCLIHGTQATIEIFAMLCEAGADASLPNAKGRSVTQLIEEARALRPSERVD